VNETELKRVGSYNANEEKQVMAGRKTFGTLQKLRCPLIQENQNADWVEVAQDYVSKMHTYFLPSSITTYIKHNKLQYIIKIYYLRVPEVSSGEMGNGML
jgi:hypothetical protein